MFFLLEVTGFLPFISILNYVSVMNHGLLLASGLWQVRDSGSIDHLIRQKTLFHVVYFVVWFPLLLMCSPHVYVSCSDWLFWSCVLISHWFFVL